MLSDAYGETCASLDRGASVEDLRSWLRFPEYFRHQPELVGRATLAKDFEPRATSCSPKHHHLGPPSARSTFRPPNARSTRLSAEQQNVGITPQQEQSSCAKCHVEQSPRALQSPISRLQSPRPRGLQSPMGTGRLQSPTRTRFAANTEAVSMRGRHVLVSELRRENDSLNRENDLLSTKILTTEGELNELKRQLAAEEEAQQALQMYVTDLESKLLAEEDRYAASLRSLRAMTQARNDLLAKFHAAERDKRHLEEETTAMADNQRAVVFDLSEQLAKLNTERMQGNIEMEQMRAMMRETASQQSDCNSENERLKKEMKDIKSDHLRKSEENAELVRKMVAVQKDLKAKADDERARYRNEHEKMQSVLEQNESLENVILDLREHDQRKAQETKALIKKLGEAQDELVVLNNEIKKVFAESSRDLELSQAKLEALSRELSACSEKLELCQREKEAQSREKAEVFSRLETSESQRETLSQEVERLRTNELKMNKEALVLMEKLEVVQERHAKASKDLDHCQEKLELAQKDRNGLQKRLGQMAELGLETQQDLLEFQKFKQDQIQIRTRIEQMRVLMRSTVQDLSAQIVRTEEELTEFGIELKKKERATDDLQAANAIIEKNILQQDELKREIVLLTEQLEETRGIVRLQNESRAELEEVKQSEQHLEDHILVLSAEVTWYKEASESCAEEIAMLKDKLFEEQLRSAKLMSPEKGENRHEKRGETGKDELLEDAKLLKRRCIELLKMAKEVVNRDLFALHRPVIQISQGMMHTRTTIGMNIVVDASGNHRVTRSIVGGPAFNSQRISEGDILLAVDGVQLQASTYKDLLKGNDVVGSMCSVTFKKGIEGTVETVTLRRMDEAVIAHKRKMADLFYNLKERFKERKDVDGGTLTSEGLELWTKTMLELHDHEYRCRDNINNMRTEFLRLLAELEALLVSFVKKQEEPSQEEEPQEKPADHQDAVEDPTSTPLEFV